MKQVYKPRPVNQGSYIPGLDHEWMPGRGWVRVAGWKPIATGKGKRTRKAKGGEE